jgi:hypothetical protein
VTEKQATFDDFLPVVPPESNSFARIKFMEAHGLTEKEMEMLEAEFIRFLKVIKANKEFDRREAERKKGEGVGGAEGGQEKGQSLHPAVPKGQNKAKGRGKKRETVKEGEQDGKASS